MELQLKIIGVILILLAIVHAAFPRRFKWKDELASLSLINRQMMMIHTFFIALTLLLMGALCIYGSNELVNAPFGRLISMGLFIFWGVRLVFQFFVYSSDLWKGKRFETLIHILFSLIWLYFTAIFGAVAFQL